MNIHAHRWAPFCVFIAGLVSVPAYSAAAPEADRDVFYVLSLNEVKFAEGALPGASADAAMGWSGIRQRSGPVGRGILEGDGEIYALLSDQNLWTNSASFYNDGRLAVRAPKGTAPKGRLILPKPMLQGQAVLRFENLTANADQKEARGQFYQAKVDYYERLARGGAPGGAWFRHQADEARAAAGESPSSAPTAGAAGWAGMPARESDLTRTYELFSGGRALSENLQLDRELRAGGAGEATVALDTLQGITTQEMDWKPLVKDLKPELDTLAAFIPADQHAIFFPSFAAMSAFLDEAKKNGTPLLRLADPRSEDAMSQERYERQLCLSMDALSKFVGEKLVAEGAFTGSDPYLRTGSDVAVLLKTDKVDALKAAILARQTAAAQANKGAKAATGDAGGVAYAGVVSPDRAVCSYMAALDGAVVVSNSTVQLEKIAKAAKGTAPAMKGLDEYVFFRDRYKRGAPDESAFLVMTDAAIRRWCGPKWRIGASRRTRVAAQMCDLQAEHLQEIAAGVKEEKTVERDTGVSGASSFRVTSAGVVSTEYGNLEFLTPIAELNFGKVTKAESDAYENFRNNYQFRWRRFFDPIAVRFSVSGDRLAGDMTVRPLIAGSEYQEFIQLTAGSKLEAGSGDPHAESLLHFAMALNPESPLFKQAESFAQPMIPGMQPNPLGWIGKSFSLYIDEDPFWEQWRAAKDTDDFIEKEFPRIPLGINVEASSAIKLVGFLTMVRAFVEQTVPGMTIWAPQERNGQAYVKVTVRNPGAGGPQGGPQEINVYYAAAPDALVVTLREDVMFRALDRRAAAKGAKAEGGAAEGPWLGESLGMRGKKGVIDAMQALSSDEYRSEMQARSWGNIPILNEWRRLFPDAPPVETHRRLWQTRLVCPGGGDYVWNEEWATMESTAYGHPGAPKDGPGLPPAIASIQSANFGLTFEANNGLRAAGEVRR